jgi:hypothetical protein
VTTTIGEGELVITQSDFHSMKAAENVTMIGRTCKSKWRGLERKDCGMTVDVGARFEKRVCSRRSLKDYCQLAPISIDK